MILISSRFLHPLRWVCLVVLFLFFSFPKRQVSFAGHRSQVAGHRSQVAGHRSQVAGHRSQVTGHRSQVAGHSPIKQMMHRSASLVLPQQLFCCKKKNDPKKAKTYLC